MYHRRRSLFPLMPLTLATVSARLRSWRGFPFPNGLIPRQCSVCIIAIITSRESYTCEPRKLNLKSVFVRELGLVIKLELPDYCPRHLAEECNILSSIQMPTFRAMLRNPILRPCIWIWLPALSLVDSFNWSCYLPTATTISTGIRVAIASNRYKQVVHSSWSSQQASVH